MIRGWKLCGLLLALLLAGGCPKPPAEEKPAVEEPATTTTAPGDTASGTTTPAAASEAADEPAPLLEPFTPPTLAELDAQVTWEEQPVRDAFEMMREDKQQHPPLVSVEEALALKNDSNEANDKILSALGQYPASASDADFEAQFDRATPFELKSTNPIMGSSTAEFDFAKLTGIGLVSGDWRFTPYADADVVSSWHASSDRLFDKFVLRDDLVWSDGEPITAHDVAFSFQTIMNPRVPVPAVRSGTDQLKWVEAYDDHTVVFFHKESLATNLWNVQFPIIPKHIYEKSLAEDYTMQTSDYHVKYERQPVTGGPFRLKSRVLGQEVVLERRENWYVKDGKEVRRKPYFKQIRFRVLEDQNTALLAIKNAQVHDYEMTNPEQWKTQTNDADFYQHNTKAWGVEWSHAYLCWNVGTPLFEDKRVRHAMSFTLNHKEMLDEICYGLYQPGAGMFHPDAWMAAKPAPTPYQQDLDKAESLLDEAGWTDSDGDGIRDKEVDGQKINFSFTLYMGEGSETAKRIATLMAENLEQIGIECRAQPMEFTVMQDKARKHEFQAMIAGWGTGMDPDFTENIFSTKAIENGRNYGMYSNPEVDALFEQGKREFDREKRALIYGQIHRILWEDQPYTWLYYRSGFFGFNKRLRGYAFSPRGPYGYGPGIDSIYMAPE